MDEIGMYARALRWPCKRRKAMVRPGTNIYQVPPPQSLSLSLSLSLSVFDSKFLSRILIRSNANADLDFTAVSWLLKVLSASDILVNGHIDIKIVEASTWPYWQEEDPGM